MVVDGRYLEVERGVRRGRKTMGRELNVARHVAEQQKGRMPRLEGRTGTLMSCNVMKGEFDAGRK